MSDVQSLTLLSHSKHRLRDINLFSRMYRLVVCAGSDLNLIHMLEDLYFCHSDGFIRHYLATVMRYHDDCYFTNFLMEMINKLNAAIVRNFGIN